MLNNKLYFNDLIFKLTNDEYNNKGYIESSGISPSFESLLFLIHELPNDLSISFFDINYPTISDPGAYITIQKNKSYLVCTIGNHGWLNKPYIISR